MQQLQQSNNSLKQANSQLKSTIQKQQIYIQSVKKFIKPKDEMDIQNQEYQIRRSINKETNSQLNIEVQTCKHKASGAYPAKQQPGLEEAKLAHPYF